VDFKISGHDFRLKYENDSYRLYSVFHDRKKKGKKYIETDRESIEIVSKDISVIKRYLEAYFMYKKNDIIKDIFKKEKAWEKL
jgi:uncharacterized protein YoxC